MYRLPKEVHLITETSGKVEVAGNAADSSVSEKFRPKQPSKRFPTSAYLPGYRDNVKSRECPRCGFEAFSYAKACRCGHVFEQ